MGTETHFVKGLLLVCIEMVKLNNLLMGTETPPLIRIYLHTIRPTIKLNNPLMGTETFQQINFNHVLISYSVKLNNPLMRMKIPISNFSFNFISIAK